MIPLSGLKQMHLKVKNFLGHHVTELRGMKKLHVRGTSRPEFTTSPD